MEKYVEILRYHNMKVTPQRLAILRFLDKNHSHPTADTIYKELKKEAPSLSKTTVYNSLISMKENGIIQSLTICGTELRFDIKEEMHHHFLCKKCGKIIDIKISCPNIKKISSLGHDIEEVHGYFIGVCKNCIKNQKGNN